MAIEVVILEYSVALVTEFIVVAVLTLLNQVIIEGRYLYDLLTLPAGRKHRALFPVMDID